MAHLSFSPDMDDLIADLRSLVEIPSVTDSPAVSDALAEALRICRRMGFRTRQVGDFLGIAEIGQGAELIGVLVHLDVVPAEGNWQYPPFALTEKDGYLYGRGVFDDKGAAVCAMYAMQDILKDGTPLNKRIRMIFGTHEEEGAWPDMDYYAANEEHPDCGFTPDGSFPVTYAEKGLARFNIRLSDPSLTGSFRALSGGSQINIVPEQAECQLADGQIFRAAGKAAHASRPELGANAVTALMTRLACENIPFAGWYLDHFRATDGSGLGISFSSENGGSTTLNVGRIMLDAGTITLEVDIRFCADYTFQEIRQAVTDCLAAFGAQVETRLFAEPVYLPPDGRVIRAMEEAYQAVTDESRKAELSAGSTYASALPNIAAFGPLLPGKENPAHQADERFSLADLETARRIYREALRNLLKI